MRKILVLFFACTLVLFSAPAFCLPLLQLDISGGTYVGALEDTVFATSESFTLYALLDSKKSPDLSGYYISAALVPNPEGSLPAGSFTFDGTSVALSTLIYGAPNGLPSHDIFDTYYKEFGFNFDSNNKASAYNSQDNPGGPNPDPTGTLYYASFSVDATGLPAGYGIHFDLYSKDGNGAVDKFAPFSHDAQTAVPEPATMLLLGSGLVGLAGFRKKFRKS
jgi:hypothetical protein